MSETLALIKRLHLRKLRIQEEINKFTMEKSIIEEKIEKLLFAQPHNRQRQSLREYSSRGPVSKFLTPTKISNELADFLGKERGTEMARPEVTREIQKYIKLNNLQDNKHKRLINPDAKLSTLLKLNDTDELTYFNLQRYITPHVNC